MTNDLTTEIVKVGDRLRNLLDEATPTVERAIAECERVMDLRLDRVREAEGHLRAALIMLGEARDAVGPDPRRKRARDRSS